MALSCLVAAGCGDEGETETTDDLTDESDPDDGSDESVDASRPNTTKRDAGKPPTSTPTPDSKSDAGGGTVKRDAGTPGGGADASTPAPAPKDAGPGNPLDGLGGLFPPPPPVSDAGTPPATGPGTCGDKTPHGCYTPAKANPMGCPATSPEIPLGLPSIDMWDLCNGGKVGAGASCVYEGPLGAKASCLCDSGAHWLCVY